MAKEDRVGSKKAPGTKRKGEKSATGVSRREGDLATPKRKAPVQALEERDEDEREEGGVGEADDPAGEPRDEAEDEAELDPEERRARERVARALGVEDEAIVVEGGEEAAAEAKGPANRAARRRETALGRKGKLPRAALAKVSGDDEDAAELLPRDRNARAKALLKRRREQAAEAPAPALEADELVGDALARASSRVGKWAKRNATALQAGAVVAVVGAAGFFTWNYFAEKKASGASSILADALAADLGRIVEEDKRPDDFKEVDPTRVYKTLDERSQAALTAYRQVVDKFAGTGLATLAKLGEAGVLLEDREWAAAQQAFEHVMGSALAKADKHVLARAVEGLGMAQEGAGNLDAARKAYQDLQNTDARGMKELGLYHEARVLTLKGDKDGAKELLKKAREALTAPSKDGKLFPALEATVTDALRAIDPTAAPAKLQLGGAKGNRTSPEELEKLLREMMPKGDAPADAH